MGSEIVIGVLIVVGILGGIYFVKNRKSEKTDPGNVFIEIPDVEIDVSTPPTKGSSSEHTMVVGRDAFNTGFNSLIQSYGSMSPSTLGAIPVFTLLTSNDKPVLLLRLMGDNPKDLFTSIETPFGTFHSADATFTDSEWRWTTSSKFTDGDVVDITFRV